MSITALIISILSLTATIVVARLVYTRTSKTLRRLDALLIAGKSFEEVRTIERLLEDIERTGEQRGRVVQRENGTWSVDWTIAVGGGVVKPKGRLSRVSRLGKSKDKV